MSLASLFHYLMINMFRMLIHPSSGACDLFVELFHGLCCSVRIEVFAKTSILTEQHQVGLSLFNCQDDARSNKHKSV